jgi:hypothetical protein
VKQLSISCALEIRHIRYSSSEAQYKAHSLLENPKTEELSIKGFPLEKYVFRGRWSTYPYYLSS